MTYSLATQVPMWDLLRDGEKRARYILNNVGQELRARMERHINDMWLANIPITITQMEDPVRMTFIVEATCILPDPNLE